AGTENRRIPLSPLPAVDQRGGNRRNLHDQHLRRSYRAGCTWLPKAGDLDVLPEREGTGYHDRDRRCFSGLCRFSESGPVMDAALLPGMVLPILPGTWQTV